MINKPKKLKVVLDTNIFIHAFVQKDDSCIDILDLAGKNKIKPLFSQDSIGELMLMTKRYAVKFESSNKKRLQILYSVVDLFFHGNDVNTSTTSCPKIRDITDEMFLKCAIEGNADHLVSNDFKSGMHKIKGYNFTVVNSKDFMTAYNEAHSFSKQVARTVDSHEEGQDKA